MILCRRIEDKDSAVFKALGYHLKDTGQIIRIGNVSYRIHRGDEAAA